MASESSQKAVEYHDLAPHAHRVAAARHEKGDHQIGHEHSRQALEYARKAYEESQEALRRSAHASGHDCNPVFQFGLGH
jgi:hypothetical protein